MPPALIQANILTNSSRRLCSQPHPSPLLPPEIVRAARPRTRSSRGYQQRRSSLILSHVLAPHLAP